MSSITRRTSALAGIAMAPVWITVVALVTALEWDYLHGLGWGMTTEHEVPYPSATARGDFGFLAVLNFLTAAVLVAFFAVGLRREFRHRISGAIATACLGLYSVGLALNVFSVDLPREQTTWHGNVHVIGFLLVLLGAVVGHPATALALRGNEQWRGWRLLGWTPVLMILVLFGAGLLPGDIGFCVLIAIMLGWVSVMGVRLLAIDRAAAGQPESAQQLPNAAAPGLL